MPKRPILVLMTFLLLLGVAPARALASHEDGIYEIPALDMWDKTHLNVLIVPPAHGPILAEEGWWDTHDSEELTPFNTYLRAVENSIAAWSEAVELFGSDELKANFNVSSYVLGRDLVPPDALLSPDILIATTEDSGLGLGFAFRPEPTCFVDNSEVFGLMGYADLYNVNGQEYGHCLGADHVGDQGGIDPTAFLQHPEHDIMNGFYTHDIGYADTHLHCVSNLDVLALEFVFSAKKGPLPLFGRGHAEATLPVDQYQTISC